MSNFLDGEREMQRELSEAEKLLIDAFYVHCESKGVYIKYSDLSKMTTSPSKFDLALLFLVHRFFQTSSYAAAFCMFFRIRPEDLIYLNQYLQSHLNYKQFKILSKWIG